MAKRKDCGVGEWLSPDINEAGQPKGTIPDDLDVVDYHTTFYGDKILDAIRDIADLGHQKASEHHTEFADECGDRFYAIMEFLKMYRAGNEALVNKLMERKRTQKAA